MARIQELAEGRFVFEGREWVATVTQTERSWQLELSHGEQRRNIAAPSCAALADAAAVAIVLSEPPAVNGPAPPTLGEPGNTSPTQPMAEVGRAERPEQSPWRPDVSGSRLSPELGGAEFSERRTPGRSPGRQSQFPAEQRPVDQRSSVAPAASAPSTTTAPEQQASWQLVAAGLWDSSVIPGGTFGAQLGAGYQWAPHQRVVALVLLLQPRRTPIETAAADAAVDYTYAAGAVRACWSTATRIALEGCTGIEIGAVSAGPVGFGEGQSEQSVFPSWALTLGSGAALGPVQLRFALEGIVPLLRDRFTANNGALVVHEAPRLSVRLGLGVTWPF